MKLDISRSEKRRLSSETRKNKKTKARGRLIVAHLNINEVKEEPRSVSRFDLQKKYEEKQRLKNLLSVAQEDPVSFSILSEIKVKKPYSQKAFDLGEPVLKHHSSGLIGEFPHKILY